MADRRAYKHELNSQRRDSFRRGWELGAKGKELAPTKRPRDTSWRSFGHSIGKQIGKATPEQIDLVYLAMLTAGV